jgi:acyl CoA:acetate/3-ketoacid CoA transferase alpha subunit
MPTTRICDSAMEAVADVTDGASLLVHSFGPPQAWPTDCLLALAERGVRDLTVVCNTPAGGPTSLNVLADKGQIATLICSYVANPQFDTPVAQQVREGKIALEMVPQGTLIERVRAGGAGLAGFYTPTGSARRPRRARSCASSTAGRSSSSARSVPTTRCSRRTRRTRSGTSSTAAACATSGPRSRWRRRRRSPR